MKTFSTSGFENASMPTMKPDPPIALAGGLKVHLKRYSRQLAEGVFMKIEKPVTPLDIPTVRKEKLHSPI